MTDQPLHPMYYPAPTYPGSICFPCGEKHGRWRGRDATWHEGTCGWCGLVKPVTEPRNYGSPEWSAEHG